MKDILLTCLLALIDADAVGIPKVEADSSASEAIANTVLFLAGAICVVFVIVGAFRYVLSEGDSGRVQQAKNTILYALVGLVVVSVSFAVVQLVISIAQR